MSMKDKKREIEESKITGFFDKDTEIKGDLNFKGTSDIKIGHLIINGEIKGNIQATEKVEINANGRVIGTIVSPKLRLSPPNWWLKRGPIWRPTAKQQIKCLSLCCLFLLLKKNLKKKKKTKTLDPSLERRHRNHSGQIRCRKISWETLSQNLWKTHDPESL